MQSFHAISLSHERTDLHLIGSVLPSFAAQAQAMNALIYQLKTQFAFEELFFLNTCNRILFIYTAPKPLKKQQLKAFFTCLNPQSTQINAICAKVDTFRGVEVLRQLFRVSSGMNSMVVGEHEILGQVKKAYQHCRTQNWIGDNLRLLFEYAIPYAKKVYHQTDIGKHNVSVVALAMEKLKKIDQPQNKKVLMLGAGESNQKVMRFLLKMGFCHVTVFNRTLEKAQTLANYCTKGEAFLLSELKNYKQGFDVLISCIDQKAHLVNEQNYPQFLAADNSSKIVIDLAVPNNIDPNLSNKFAMEFVDVESLRTQAKANLDKRKLSLTDAEIMIEQQLKEFQIIFKKRKIERALTDIPKKMKQVKNHTLETVFKKDLQKVDAETRLLIEKMLTYVEKKYISIPMTMAHGAIFDTLEE